jgi:rhomboid protease GluP
MSEPILQRIKKAPATLFVSLVYVGVFIAASTTGSTLDHDHLVRFGAKERSLVWAGEYWRMITPVFLHIGWIHLLFNTIFGWELCSWLERSVGWWRFLVAFLVCGIGGSAASMMFNPHTSAGASGALFGMIGVTLAVRRITSGSWSGFFRDPEARRTLFNIAIWTVIGMTVFHFDNFAHMGGLATGFVVGLLMGMERSTKQRWVPWAIIAALGIALFVAGVVRWPWQKTAIIG